MSTTTTATRAAEMALAVVVLGSASAVAGAVHANRPARATIVAAGALVEDPDCQRSDHVMAIPLPQHDTAMTQTLSVVVPAVTMLRTDHTGRVVAAATNTGCAPAPGDLVYEYAADGSVRPRPDIDVAARPWVGDFTEPAVFQPQPDG